MSGHLCTRVVVALLLTCTMVGSVRAQLSEDDVSALRADLTGLREQVLILRAEVAVLEGENRDLAHDLNLAAPRGWGEDGAPSDLIALSKSQLGDKHDQLRRTISDLARQASKEKTETLAAWRKANEQTLITEAKLRDWQDHRREVRDGGFWTWFTVALVALVLFVVGLGIALTFHERRIVVRRWMRGRMKSAAVVALMLMPIPVLAQTYHELVAAWEKERNDLKGEKALLETQRQTLQREVQEKLLNSKDAWDKRFPQDHFVSAWQDALYQKMHQYLVDTRIIELAAEDGQKQTTIALQYREELAAAEFNTEVDWFQRFAIRMGLIGGAIVLSFGLVYRTRARERKRVREAISRCPRCNAKAKLEIRAPVGMDDSVEQPTTDRQCSKCDYRFSENFLEVSRVRFPYVGVRGSGKTHSIVSVYENVIADGVQIPSDLGEEICDPRITQEYDGLSEDIHEALTGPAPTVPDELPWPLTFSLRDTDRWGRNAAMVNLFDFSGELMNRRIDTDLHRLLALQMDGFVFFLDPTQVQSPPLPGKLDLAQQVASLKRFYAEMRKARRLWFSKRFDVPIAVCISKIDLLISHNPLDDAARPFIEKLRQTEGKPITLSLLQYRSRLCEHILPNAFPGFDIRASLREHFGRRFLFFPLSPVGLDHLGEDELPEVQNPFATIEPILWLLHMKGYNVLPE